MSIVDRSQGRWGLGRVGGRRGGPRRRPRGAIGLEILEIRVVPSTISTWSGLDAANSTNWNDTGNWVGDQLPAAGNNLVFPSGAPGLSNTNNIGTGIAYGSLTVAGSGYSIGGASATFTSIDASQMSGSSEVDLPITLAGPGTVSVDQLGAQLVLGGAVSGSIGLTKSGPGALDLTVNNTYTGNTAINAGTMLIDGVQGGSPVTAASGTTLGGVGTVGSISTAGATLTPGNGTTAGLLTDTGSLTLGQASGATNSTYSVVIDGSNAGTGADNYSQTKVAGSIILNNPTLNVTLGPDFTQSVPTAFTIINSTGSSPLSGTFNGLVQGSTIVVPDPNTNTDVTFAISYDGGANSNSVVLTEVFPSAATVAATPNPAVWGQPVDLTATVSGPDGDPTPTGTVDFFNGSTLLGTGTLASGIASLPAVTTLPVADNGITVKYLGDSNYAGVTSASTSVTVNQAAATVSLSAFPVSPVSNTTITFTANVAAASPGAGTPTGSVTFFSNGTDSLGSGLIANGVATLTTSSIATGAYTITAVYGGDTNFQSGATSPGVPLNVAQTATTTTNLTPSTTSPVLGQSVNFTATVAPISPATGTPTGTIQILSGTTVLGSGTLSAGSVVIPISTLALGSNSITAVYSGDNSFTSSSSTAQTVTVQLANSSTVVTFAPTTPVANQSITLTATVTAVSPGTGTPSGTVQFFNGSTLLGSPTLNSSGVATFTVSAGFSAGANTIHATYEGDTSHFNGSTSPDVTVTVASAATSTTTVTFSPSAPTYGVNVTLTATVGPISPLTGTPTGTVVFFNGTTSLGMATLTNGVASLAPMALSTGANSITAQYSGDSTFTSSTSSVTTVTVALATTTTAVTFSPSAPVFGQSVALTATITPTTTGAVLPTGQVSFFNGSTLLGTATATSGVATLNLNTLLVGPNTVTAQYGGDTNYAASTSPAVSVPVSQASSSTTVTFFPVSPVAGQNVTLTATVGASGVATGTPTGSVQFFSGTTSLGTVAISGGVATLTTTALLAGDNSITGQYSGDANFVASTSPAVSVAVAATATSTTTVTFTPTTPSYGQSVTLTATIAPVSPLTGAPTGTVEFFNGTTLLAKQTLTAGTSSSTASFTTSNLPVAGNLITAQYSGDSNFTSSTSSQVTVTVAPVVTTTVLTFTPTSPTFGTTVEFTATVTPASTGPLQPTGDVDFFDGSTLLGSVLISDDVATFSTSTLPVASNSITAKYVGDTNYATSTSTPATIVTVAPGTTTTAVSFSPVLPVFGQVVTLTATITPGASSSVSPTGTVDFFNGTTLLGTGTVSNDVATLNTTALPVGTTAVVAQYLGDSNYSGSTSAVDAFAVVLAATTTSVSTSNSHPAAFESVTLSAAVAVTSPGAGTATGTVEFFANGVELGTATLNNGVASLSVVPPVAINSITAQYLGSTDLQTSTSTAITVTVGTANEQWLTQVYLVEVGRSPSQAELTKATRQLASGVSRKTIVTKIANSPEATSFMVQSDYQHYLGVQPTAKEVHQTLSEAQRTHTSVLAVILGSDLFFEQSGGGLFNYLGALEQAVLGTQIAQPGLQAKLEQGVSRTKVANDLIQSNVGQLSIVPKNFVAALGRAPTRAELGNITSLMSRGTFLRNIIASLLASNDFYKQSTT